MSEVCPSIYWQTNGERLRLGVPQKVFFTNPGPKEIVWVKGQAHVWSEDGTALLRMDEKHQREARAQRREVVIKKR